MRTLTLPQAGKAPSSATVLRWRSKVGEVVAKGQVLVEVETDEGLVEIESVVAGLLNQILAPAGKTLAIGAPLATIDPGGSASSAAPAESASAAPVSPKSAAAMNAPVPPAGKVVPILMPKAGQSMEEGTIVKWHVQPGAAVKKGDVIFEIETDKATMEVEAVDEGRLARIVLAEGGVCPVQQPVAYLADSDADVDAYIASQGGVPVAAGQRPAEAQNSELSTQDSGLSSQSAVRNPQSAMTDSGRVKASPAARKIATERGIDLATVGQGSGPGGRILSTDVPATAPAIRPAAAAAIAPAGVPVSSADLPPGVVRKRMSTMRKAIARNLTLSKTTIPHWYISAKINAGALMAFYKSQKAKYPVSLNDVIVMACAKVIMEFPAFRSRVDGETILEFPGANIGVAVGMDDGLVVPVVMNAERFSLEKLGEETKRLATSARSGKIENMGMGIFTISNLGMFGVDDFVAIVNPPEAAILAVSAAKEDIIVKDGAIKAGQTMNITLSSDHRLIDGTLGAQFMAKLKTLLENPIQLIA